MMVSAWQWLPGKLVECASLFLLCRTLAFAKSPAAAWARSPPPCGPHELVSSCTSIAARPSWGFAVNWGEQFTTSDSDVRLSYPLRG